jgi:hypothetical protein
MLAATVLGIFFVPALFVFFERLAGRGGARREPGEPLPVEVPATGAADAIRHHLTSVD